MISPVAYERQAAVDAVDAVEAAEAAEAGQEPAA
jgi:hypothetical protein